MGSDKTTQFGQVASEMLKTRNLRVSAVAPATGVSASHAYNMVRGERTASPEFVQALALAVDATPDECRRLNIAAARDAGFNLELPEDW